jgi:hypothetical protein
MTNETLRNYQDVTFSGPTETLAALGEQLEAILPRQRWSRDREKENNGRLAVHQRWASYSRALPTNCPQPVYS